MVTCCGPGAGPQANEGSTRSSADGGVSVMVQLVPTGRSGVDWLALPARLKVWSNAVPQLTRTANLARAVIPWVSPVIALVTLTCPKTGMVGLVTVRVIEPLARDGGRGPGRPGGSAPDECRGEQARVRGPLLHGAGEPGGQVRDGRACAGGHRDLTAVAAAAVVHDREVRTAAPEVATALDHLGHDEGAELAACTCW